MKDNIVILNNPAAAAASAGKTESCQAKLRGRSARILPQFKERQRLPALNLLIASEPAELGSFYHL